MLTPFPLFVDSPCTSILPILLLLMFLVVMFQHLVLSVRHWFHQSYLFILEANVELVAFQIQFVTMKWKASCPQIKTLRSNQEFCQWHNIHCSFINNTWWWKRHRINFLIEGAPLYPFLLDLPDIYELHIYLSTCNTAIKKVITPGFIELIFQENETNVKQ